MRILITGGFGYLGGRLADFLSSTSKHELVLASRTPPPSVSGMPRAAPVRLNWESQEDLDKICDGVDAVVHLAGMNARACTSDPPAALRVNGVYTSSLVESAGRRGVRRFIYMSSVHVYGTPLHGVVTERTCPEPRGSYATSHRAGEDAVLEAWHGKRVESAAVVRLSNGFGPPLHATADCWSLLVNDLARQAAESGRIELKTAGTQRRDFVPVSEVCAALRHLLELDTAQLRGPTYNLGGQWAPTVWEVALLVQERCEAVLGFRPSLHRPEPRDPPDAVLDYRIDELLATGFRPVSERILEIDRLLEQCASRRS